MNVLYTTVWSFLYGSAELHFCFIVINTEIYLIYKQQMKKISEKGSQNPNMFIHICIPDLRQQMQNVRIEGCEKEKSGVNRGGGKCTIA